MTRSSTYLRRTIIAIIFMGCLGLMVLLGGSGKRVAASPMLLNYTPSATVTGTPPTATSTRTPTNTRTPTSTRTPLATPGPCGDWRHFPAPVGNGYTNTLRDVDAVSANDVWAVGDQGGAYESLIQHWDGQSWEIVSSPNPLTLKGVAAIASDDVWAVGYPDSYGATRTIHWDGTAWSVVPSPNVPGVPNYLYAVAASGPNDVWAVGKANSRPLFLHWNGTEWSIVPTPAGVYGTLNAVSALAPDDAWAVGTVGAAHGDDFTVALHWDGTSWTRVDSPSPGTYHNILYGVTMIAADDVWAVGSQANGPTGYQGLLMHWDGSTWELSPAPGLAGESPNTYGVYYYAVDAASTDEVWAVGRDYISSDTESIIVRWDGNSWAESPHPDPSRSINRLLGVAAVAPGEAWAVGTYWEDDTNYYRALIERYGPGCGTPVPATPTGTAIGATNTPISGTSTPAGATNTPISGTSTPVEATSTAVLPTGTPVDSTATAIATATSCPGLVINGSLTLNDPTQAGRLNTLLEASTCDNPRGCPGAIDNIVPRHYDAYAFVNTSNSTACFTVDIAAACLDEILIHSSVYLNSFDPQNLCENYLADVGPGVLINSQYSFNVPAGARFVVVVNELAPNLLCPNYTLTVTGPACPAPSTPVPTSTSILPTLTVTVTPLATLEACTVQFSDVAPGDTFYAPVMCLTCMNLIGGYSDGTFRPYNQVTRGQLAKLVSNAAGFNETSMLDQQTFEDVPIGSTFHMYVERVASRGIISGYPCGGEGEACGAESKPYFRPGANATRGQISKIVSNAARMSDVPASQTFEDVPPDSTFYLWIERLAMHEMMGGYPCGGPGEPCGPDNKPYFRWANDATRGQTSKIVAHTFYPGCQP